MSIGSCPHGHGQPCRKRTGSLGPGTYQPLRTRLPISTVNLLLKIYAAMRLSLRLRPVRIKIGMDTPSTNPESLESELHKHH